MSRASYKSTDCVWNKTALYWKNTTLPWNDSNLPWIGQDWVGTYALPNGTLPSMVLDFVNDRYFNGSEVLLSTVITNPSRNSTGLDCSGNGYVFKTPIINALNATAVTAVMEFATSTATTAVGLTTNATNFIIGRIDGAATGLARTYDGSNVLDVSNANGGFTYAHGTNKIAVAYDGTGRSIAQSSPIRAATDAHTQAAATTSGMIGNYTAITNAYPWGGRIRSLVIYATRVTDQLLSKLANGMHRGIYFGNNGGATTTDPAVCAFERTQPYTAIARVFCGTSLPGLANVIYSNVSHGAAYTGHELWLDTSGFLRVRMISNFATTNYLDVIGTTNVCDGACHVVAATYDGSSTAAGVELWVDGVKETVTIAKDTLSGTIIGSNIMTVGAQETNVLPLAEGIDYFSLATVKRDATYMARYFNAPALPEPQDGNIQMQYVFEEGTGTTIADQSGNSRNLTITGASNIWF